MCCWRLWMQGRGEFLIKVSHAIIRPYFRFLFYKNCIVSVCLCCHWTPTHLVTHYLWFKWLFLCLSVWRQCETLELPSPDLLTIGNITSTVVSHQNKLFQQAKAYTMNIRFWFQFYFFYLLPFFEVPCFVHHTLMSNYFKLSTMFSSSNSDISNLYSEITHNPQIYLYLFCFQPVVPTPWVHRWASCFVHQAENRARSPDGGEGGEQ